MFDIEHLRLDKSQYVRSFFDGSSQLLNYYLLNHLGKRVCLQPLLDLQGHIEIDIEYTDSTCGATCPTGFIHYLRDTKPLFNILHQKYLVTNMADEEKYRLEDPEQVDEPVEEKKGLFRPLPKSERKTHVKDGKAQPIVKFLGISMYEKNRDILVLLLMPMLTGLINSSVYSYVTLSLVPSTAEYLFYIPVIAAIPIGLVVAETGPALIGGFLSAFFFFIFFIIFLTTPAFFTPELGIANFLVSGIALSVGYFLFVIVAGLLGSVIGTIMREFL